MTTRGKLQLAKALFGLGFIGLYISTFVLDCALITGTISGLIFILSAIWLHRNDPVRVISTNTETFEFQKEIGKSLPPDEERLAAIRRTQEAVRPPEGFDIRKAEKDSVNLYWIYWGLLKNVVDKTHYPTDTKKLLPTGDKGPLNAIVTHVESCPDCQRLLGYVTRELQKILPTKGEKE